MEQQIGAIIQASTKQTPMLLNVCNNISLTSKRAWLTKWKGRSEIVCAFSPMQWGYAASNPEKAYMADCPTLLQLDALYGGGTSAYWVDTQVSALFGSSSSREKGIVDGIVIFCQSFSSQISGFKMSEVMLFFARYKAGRYDNSYGAFDSRRIGNAFFKEFVPERNKELDLINRNKLAEEIERRRFVPPKGHTSLSLVQELRRRAADGDKEALRQLTPP